MNIHFISDIHIDFWVKEKNPQKQIKMDSQIDTLIKYMYMEDTADVLVIPGDLGHYYTQDTRFLSKCKEIYKHIILVRGNHDMYLVGKSNKDRYELDSFKRVEHLKDWCKSQDGIHYLDGDIVEIEGVKFGGVGMSWDTSYASKIARGYNEMDILSKFKKVMNDAKLITKGKRNSYYGSYHEFDPYSYFKEEYAKLQLMRDYDDIDVMVSHYGPVVPENMPIQYRNITSTFYYFDGLKDIQRISPKYWLFGHTHDRYDFMVEDTRLMCNPLGYPGEMSGNFIQEIEI